MMIKVSLVLLLSLFGIVYSQKPNYCQANLPKPSLNTNGLSLEMVQVLLRHGDRTPLYSNLSPDMSIWDCDLGWFMSPSFENIPGPITDINRLYRKVYMPNREFLPGNCSKGQLTSLGFAQHIQLGQTLRELYVDKYQLLPNQYTQDQTKIWVRSTDVPRTLQSAQAHLTGLFPPQPTNGEPIPVININTMDPDFENMQPNNRLCPVISMMEYNATKTPEYQEFIKNTTQLKTQIMNALGVKSFPAYGWYSFMDLFYSLQCHDLPLPPGITQEMVDGAYEAALWDYTYKFSFPMYSRLGMSTFLEELLENIGNYIQNTDDTKYYLFSGHDTTIGAIANLFGLLGEWPSYASHIEMELWSNSNKNYFLQFKYNGESFQLNGCGDIMCPIETFFNIANSLIVPNYSDICSN
ncbi:hypothetical protein DICPUDRAFT_82266 [Dictyostelium purpureum]|uniref:Acid phosphatase n=1 Tax=Dictyostelium purpureum TaxID=5786 RepID=F0ZW09_DICPU|nr:uncharacterized protein DICPUDRAFT_82266 [Dictyostelium purpureum]EGC31876.1 hypothetical protein DICPUDRAFT_82266 [Dictyostelium purpureum]|eukprot:XP_003291610.1 hypothetical protein DICPUDRAFT_82266 [Dictyostelium purpureum]